jgi:predicted transcriptional regulator
MPETPSDLLRLFAKREAVLHNVADGPVSKCDLVRSLAVSRSTIDRCIRELVERDVLTRGDDGYELTLLGRLLYEEYSRFHDRAAGVSRSVGFLSALPADAPLEPVVLVGADVTEATRTAPYRPVEAHLDLVRRATSIRLLSTAVSSQYVDVVGERVVDGGMELSVGCAPEVVEYLVSEEAEALQESFETGRLELCELEETPPFTVGVVETPEAEHVSLLAYDDDGIRGHVRNDDPGAMAWAEEFVDRRMTVTHLVAPPARSSD